VAQLKVEAVVMVAQPWWSELSSSFFQMASPGLLQVRVQRWRPAQDLIIGFEDSLLNQLLDSAATST
jgi:hypothetical protein